MSSTKINCTGVRDKETTLRLCRFGNVIQWLLNQILKTILKEQFKNTFCSDYDNIPSIHRRGIHITGIQ